MKNIDEGTVRGFGDEWSRFDQSGLTEPEKRDIFQKYFRMFPFTDRSIHWEGFDLGCGSGRWASLVAPRVGKLNLVDASAEALSVARRNLSAFPYCEFYNCSAEEMPLADGSQDFGYSLGVIHHIPDSGAALACCVKKLKPGAPFLVYVYYAFDNRPWWFRRLWQMSELLRKVIARMPSWLRYQLSQVIAALVYWPLARVAGWAERAGRDVSHWPLSFYSKHSFYVMRNDSLDRFGTRLEQRFTRAQLERMMLAAGLQNIQFSGDAPFWCALGYKREPTRTL